MSGISGGDSHGNENRRTKTETQDIPGGTETTSASHEGSGDDKTEISENVTEDTIKGEEANEI